MNVLQTETESPCDISDQNALNSIINRLKPGIIIHTAGLSSLEKCEKEEKTAYRINTEGTNNIINAMQNFVPQSKLIFLSTDYVFDGSRGMYKEEEIPNPVTVYGKTKLKAENSIMDNLKNHAICRTANVYGRGGNFFNYILSSLDSNTVIKVFQDAFFSPTCIDNLLEMITMIIEKDQTGLFHTAGSERINRYNFAKKIAKAFKKDENLITEAKRPADSLIAFDLSLSIEKTRQRLGIDFFDITRGLETIRGN